MEHCDECGFFYDEHGPDRIAEELTELGSHYSSRLRVPPDLTSDHDVLHARRDPNTWSAVEYSCHVRDVLLAQRERLYLTLVTDTPTFAPIFRDQRAIVARYAEETAGQISDELEFASRLTGWAFAGLDGTAWSRRCIYNFPEPAERTVIWLAQHTLHEGLHHLLDVDRSVEAAS